LPKLTPPELLTAKPVAGLVDAPTAAHVNAIRSKIKIISHLVPLTLLDVCGNFCAVTTRKVKRNVTVADDTAHFCVGVGPMVGGLNDLCVCNLMNRYRRLL
jgi:hypothetical protein